jgi:hypothetical protein
MHNTAPISTLCNLPPDLQNTPPLLDIDGVRKHIAPIGRTLLHQLASAGEIQTVSLGMGKRGKRLYLTASLLDYIRRRAGTTQRPNVACKGVPTEVVKPAAK